MNPEGGRDGQLCASSWKSHCCQSPESATGVGGINRAETWALEGAQYLLAKLAGTCQNRKARLTRLAFYSSSGDGASGSEPDTLRFLGRTFSGIGAT